MAVFITVKDLRKDDKMEKNISILGVTGSVGMQALDVALARGYGVDLISANSDVSGAESAARRLKPRFVAMADENAARELKLSLSDTDIKVLSGPRGIIDGIFESQSDVIVNSIIGAAGLEPTLAVIDAKKRLALANKESLVIAGTEVMRRAESSGVEIIPVDSEHSAIFQSLRAGKKSEIKKIILTASGGPFFGRTKKELRGVTLEDTLRHPTWKMGKKITVDSATLMNKGFEVIEAAHLFSVPESKIQVTVHRESILHSAVEYIDNSVIGELSGPDMRMCVQYAVDYPERCVSNSAELDLFSVAKLTFLPVDEDAFPLLPLAKRALMLGGGMGAVLNAADEVAVGAFLRGEVAFYEISEIVSETFSRLENRCTDKTIEDFFDADREARLLTSEIIKSTRRKI